MVKIAFTVTDIRRGVIGDLRYVMGKYVNDSGSTGGEVPTGLSIIQHMTLQAKGSSVIADAPALNETLPLSSGDATIVTASNETGYFLAVGI